MLAPSSPADAVIAHLKTLRMEKNIAGMARFGIETAAALGISNPDLKRVARLINATTTAPSPFGQAAFAKPGCLRH